MQQSWPTLLHTTSIHDIKWKWGYMKMNCNIKCHNCCFNFPFIKLTTEFEVFTCFTFPFSEQVVQVLEPNYAWLCNIYTHWQAQPILQPMHPYLLHWSSLFRRQFPHQTHLKWQQSSSHVANSKYDSLAESQWFSHMITILHHKSLKHHPSPFQNTSTNNQQQERNTIKSKKAHNFKLPNWLKTRKMENLEWIMERV